MNLKRILTIAALVVIAVLLVSLLYFATIGAKEATLAILFCLMVVPTVIYIFIWFTNLTRK